MQVLVDREYYLPGGFAESLSILIDGASPDLKSGDHFKRAVRFSPLQALVLQLGLQIVAAEAGSHDAMKSETAALLTAVFESASRAADSGAVRGGGDWRGRSVVVVDRCKSPWWPVTRALQHGAEASIWDREIARLLAGSVKPIAEG